MCHKHNVKEKSWYQIKKKRNRILIYVCTYAYAQDNKISILLKQSRDGV